MHNERVTRLARPFGILTAAMVVSLTACGGGADPTSTETPATPETSETSETPENTPEPTETAEDQPYLPVPAGVELTPQGSLLDVGDAAVVAYEPRQDLVGVLGIKVTKLERTTLNESFSNWVLDKKSAKSRPYFVRAKVSNAGNTDLSGRPVPLYIVDGTGSLVEATGFTERFGPCPDGVLPKKFAPGDVAKVCLVFLAPDRGKLTAVSFRPEQAFDQITWTGEITSLKPDKADKTDKPGRAGGDEKTDQ